MPSDSTATEHVEVRAQPGAQEAFLACQADIAIYGGAAGAGKTYALLMEPLYHVSNPGFMAVVFRRTYKQVTQEGGLWDTSETIYPHQDAKACRGAHEWRFPSGATVGFAHMQHEDDRFNWDGAQIPLICFDQLEHFTRKQFVYMLARNRTSCGVKPYIRATCNPDPDSFLREWLAWWIDETTGYPIPERSGIVRFFAMRGDELVWGESPETVKAILGPDTLPKSLTFIPGTVEDNQILLRQNPEYLASLEALGRVDRERLRKGNWNIRDMAGSFFRREWFSIVEAAPILDDSIRYWDRAATAAVVATDRSSWTAGVHLGHTTQGLYVVCHSNRFHGSPLEVERAVRNTAEQDGHAVRVGIEQDPGQAGKAEAQVHIRNLAGYNATVNVVREAKAVRVRPFSAQAEAGNVVLVRGAWNADYLAELENFDGSRDCVSDQVDASSGAFYLLTQVKRAGVWGR